MNLAKAVFIFLLFNCANYGGKFFLAFVVECIERARNHRFLVGKTKLQRREIVLVLTSTQ